MHYTGQLSLPDLFGQIERGEYDIRIPHGSSSGAPNNNNNNNSSSKKQQQQQPQASADSGADIGTTTGSANAAGGAPPTPGESDASDVRAAASSYWFSWLWGPAAPEVPAPSPSPSSTGAPKTEGADGDADNVIFRSTGSGYQGDREIVVTEEHTTIPLPFLIPMVG